MLLSAQNVKQARVEQTAVELHRLADEAARWVAKRLFADKQKQHQTQLKALEAFLRSATDFLQGKLGEINTGSAPADVYEECRMFDLRILWLRRVWSFFKDKFDQRDDPTLSPLLEAADQIVWSCYHQVFAQAEVRAPTIKQGVVPLPFVEFAYSPLSLPSELVPYDLKPDENGFLKDLIARLPVPLVSLPQACVQAPWWLIYIGHEVGHHIQYALAAGGGMVTRFQQLVETTAAQHTPDHAEEVQLWGRWSKEIFADLFSVLMMGHWAVWAMAEFETVPTSALFIRRPQYPAPVVRLWLLAYAANKLGADGAGALRGLEPKALAAGNETAERDLMIAEHVVDAALDHALPGATVKLRQLAAFNADDFQPSKTVERWARALRGQEPESVKNDVRAARLAACAAVAAWVGALVDWERQAVDAQERFRQRQTLAAAVLAYIAKNSDPTERAEPIVATDGAELGAELAKRLMAADLKQLTI